MQSCAALFPWSPLLWLVSGGIGAGLGYLIGDTFFATNATTTALFAAANATNIIGHFDTNFTANGTNRVGDLAANATNTIGDFDTNFTANGTNLGTNRIGDFAANATNTIGDFSADAWAAFEDFISGGGDCRYDNDCNAVVGYCYNRSPIPSCEPTPVAYGLIAAAILVCVVFVVGCCCICCCSAAGGRRRGYQVV